MRNTLVVLAVLFAALFVSCANPVMPEPVPVEVVTVELGTFTGTAYTAGNLTATVTSSTGATHAVTWASSDETIATVVDGTVTPLKGGTVTITATAADVSDSVELTFNDVRLLGTWKYTVPSGPGSGNVWTLTIGYAGSSGAEYGSYVAEIYNGTTTTSTVGTWTSNNSVFVTSPDNSSAWPFGKALWANPGANYGFGTNTMTIDGKIFTKI